MKSSKLPCTRRTRTLLFISLLLFFAVSSSLGLSLSLSTETAATTITSTSPTVLVFGGSGFVGRRVCSSLVNAGCNVISISKSGKPPPYYCTQDSDNNNNNNNNNSNSNSNKSSNNNQNWSDLVTWIAHDINPNVNGDLNNDNNGNDNNEKLLNALPKIDTAVSCIGNVNPDQEWDKLTFFGLAFNDERLFRENGTWNEVAATMSKQAGATKFVYMSVSYEVAKTLEGPLVGYMDGKRHAEHVAAKLFGDDHTIVLGPSLIYGGKRFPTFGFLYRKIVDSFLAKSFLNTNDTLRNLSPGLEDWVEKTLFSPPVDVSIVASVTTAAAFGLVTRDLVKQRRQGFFDTNGKPVVYDDVIYISGTEELERLNGIVKSKIPDNGNMDNNNMDERRKRKETISNFLLGKYPNGVSKSQHDDEKQPLFEGALIGKAPYLYPLPVVAFFSSIFLLVATNQFVSDVP